MKFSELDLHPAVMRGIEDAGFIECTPVQEATLRHTLAGGDVCVQSQTGTGKTAAFLITIFHHFCSATRFTRRKALILTPTRELAVQIQDDAQKLGKYCGLGIGCFYGGVGYAEQDRLLKNDLNLYIGTPGRIIDFQKSGKINLHAFDFLVIDEADRMFDMGFIPDIRYMVKRMVPPQQRMTMLLSATLSDRVKYLAWEYMNEPVEIEINPEKVTVDLIDQRIYHIGKEDKFGLLLGILRREQPKSALIFTNMKVTAERISRRLAANGIPNDYLSGDLPQSKRLQIIDSIKSGKTEILVATDVAARGLHIEELDMVINYDLPEESQNYVHRIGRTARAGKSGKAVSLACEDDVFYLAPIERLIGMRIPVEWPDDDLIVTDAIEVSHRSTDKRERGRRKERVKDKQRLHAARNAGDRQSPRYGGPGQEKLQKKETRTQKHETGEHERRSHRDASRSHQPKRQGTIETRNINEKNNRNRRPGKTADARTNQAKHHESAIPKERRSMPRLSKDATPEERIEYYRKKYGDNFEKAGNATTSARRLKPKTLLESIKGLFKNKK